MEGYGEEVWVLVIREIRPNRFPWISHALYDIKFGGSIDVENGPCVGGKSDSCWDE